MQPSDPLPDPGDAGRRLTRSSTDKHVAGVAGGLGRYFGVDPLIFRIAFGVSVLLSGIGILAYLALLAFIPTDDGEPAWIENRSRATTIVLTVVMGIVAVSMLAPPAFILGPGLVGVAGLSVLGVVLYRAFGGSGRDDPARAIARATLVLIVLAAAMGAATAVGFVAAIGGGTAMAVIAICAGFGLIAAGLLGGPRWLILPVMVFVLPLAVVSAADIDLRGGVGDRSHRPDTLADIRPEYRIGIGQVEVDLRGVTLPAGRRTEVKVRVGVGQARVRVPAGTCVTTDAEIGVGEIDVDGRSLGRGPDIGVDPSSTVPAGRPQLLVRAEVGVGHVEIDRDDVVTTSAGCA